MEERTADACGVGAVYKNVGGTIYVKYGDAVLPCRIRGAIRESIFVGDLVEIDVRRATVERLIPRRNLLHRPVIANVDYVLIVFSAKDPTPSFLLLDRILVAAEHEGIVPILCMNKTDLADVDLGMYEGAGYRCFKISVAENRGVDALRGLLKDRITVLAGPSGVGKSSLTSLLIGEALRTSEVSRAANRGRHTTRHSEMFELPQGGLLVDSPGFGAMNLHHVGREGIRPCYPEFRGRICRFADCTHRGEPDCSVRAAAENGEIPQERYRNYLKILEEL